jgi:hypothetical protein
MSILVVGRQLDKGFQIIRIDHLISPPFFYMPELISFLILATDNWHE